MSSRASSWTPLAQRLPDLPLVLAGPILRRVEPRSVTVWVALREARLVTLGIYQRDATSGQMTERLRGARRTVRLGDHLHVAAVTARAPDEVQALDVGQVYCYDLFFDAEQTEGAREAPDLGSPGVLVADPRHASALERLTYDELPLPSFVLPAATLDQARIFHGSCRKPHGVGRDALATLDLVLSRSASDPFTRPQQLYLTGDQIYADDVATALLAALMDAAEVLVGHEDLPGLLPALHLTAPGQRAWVVREVARFTTATPQNQLLTRGEYLAMYLFTWSDVLWPNGLPSQEQVQRAHHEPQPRDKREQDQAAAHWLADEQELASFRETLPQVRRALANIPTYMICDDHDVTDDWYLDGAWCANVLGSPLGRHIVRNALYAYALCQAWGNDPEQFDAVHGQAFLNTVDRWRGAEDGADARLLADYLALPTEFSGEGTLPRSERALRWHFTLETPAYRMLVLDSRTHRIYEHPHAAPGLLSEEAMAEQVGEPIPGDGRLTMLVTSTPVLGVDIVEKIQLLSLDHYAYDRESWSINRQVCQALLRRLARFGPVVMLSGDVHYGFGSTMEYWERATDERAEVCNAVRGKATIVNFTSSAFKNSAAGVDKALLTVAYPHLFHMLSRGRMPPIDLFAWNDKTPENATALAAATRAVQHGALAIWWSVPRVATLLSSPDALMLPAHGWPAHTFDQSPPERRLRLRYLRDSYQPVEPEEHTIGPGAELQEAFDRHTAHDQRVRETVAALGGGAQAGAEKALEEVARVFQSSESRHLARVGIAQRILHLAQSAFNGAHVLPDLQEHLSAGIGHLLHTALAHPELWARVWSDGGLHIVGDTNIGEIRFEDGGHVATQQLWWYSPDAPGSPSPATAYRAGLQTPAAEDAPPLP